MSLGNGTYHPASISYWDKSLETGIFQVYGLPVTATIVSTDVVNFTAQSVAWAALVSAANALDRGLIRSQRWVNEVIVNARPDQADVNQSAAREVKLEIQWIDSVTQKSGRNTLPSVNLLLLTYMPQAKDYVAITTEQGAGTEVTDFVSAFEGYVVNPDTGNSVTVVGLKVVGRNN